MWFVKPKILIKLRQKKHTVEEEREGGKKQESLGKEGEGRKKRDGVRFSSAKQQAKYYHRGNAQHGG